MDILQWDEYTRYVIGETTRSCLMFTLIFGGVAYFSVRGAIKSILTCQYGSRKPMKQICRALSPLAFLTLRVPSRHVSKYETDYRACRHAIVAVSFSLFLTLCHWLGSLLMFYLNPDIDLTVSQVMGVIKGVTLDFFLGAYCVFGVYPEPIRQTAYKIDFLENDILIADYDIQNDEANIECLENWLKEFGDVLEKQKEKKEILIEIKETKQDLEKNREKLQQCQTELKAIQEQCPRYDGNPY